jgi:hypothetical protein
MWSTLPQWRAYVHSVGVPAATFSTLADENSNSSNSISWIAFQQHLDLCCSPPSILSTMTKAFVPRLRPTTTSTI